MKLQINKGLLIVTTAKRYSAKPELRFCAGLISKHCVSEVCDGENLNLPVGNCCRQIVRVGLAILWGWHLKG